MNTKLYLFNDVCMGESEEDGQILALLRRLLDCARHFVAGRY